MSDPANSQAYGVQQQWFCSRCEAIEHLNLHPIAYSGSGLVLSAKPIEIANFVLHLVTYLPT